MDQTTHWTALMDAVDQRRAELGLRWRQVAEAMPMSEANLRKIRKGLIDLTSFHAAALERALHWPAGTVQEILATGHAPQPVEAPTGGPAGGLRDPLEQELWRIRHATKKERRALIAVVRALRQDNQGDEPESGYAKGASSRDDVDRAIGEGGP